MHHFVVKFSKFSSPQDWQGALAPLTKILRTFLPISIGNESAVIQLAAQCWFPGLAISSAKYKYILNKIYGSNHQTALGNGYGLKLPKC